MSDPRRILDDDPSAPERRLLGSARLDEPSHAAQRRTIAALGIAAVTTATSASGASSSLLGNGLVLKAVAVAVIGGTVVWGTTRLSPPSRSNVPSVAPVLSASASPRAAARLEPGAPIAPSSLEPLRAASLEGERPAPKPPQRTSPAPQPPRTRSPVAGVSSSQSSGSAAPATTDFAFELSVLRDARAALARAQPGAALGLLDTYARRSLHPLLGPEAAVLRIESLVALGRLVEAQGLADELLREEPHTPYAQRIRSLLSKTP